MGAFIAAVRLLTVLPVPGRPSDAASIARSPMYFPLVGLGVGGTMALVNWLAGLALPALPTAALAVAAGIAVTGALHLDGLADTFDGVFGGKMPERRLEIMRDASIGAFGIVAIIVVVLIKWSAVASMGFGSAWAALLIAPALGRLAVALVMATIPYARESGLGTPYRRGLGWSHGVALLATATVAVLLLGPWALIAVIVAIGAGQLVALYAASKLGGVTGDVYGACIEIAEAASLLCLLALFRSSLGFGFPLGG